MTTTATRPTPRHTFTTIFGDGSALCLSGRSRTEYAVSLRDCDCIATQGFHRPSCSHRDQFADALDAVGIVRASQEGFSQIGPVFRSETPCRACGGGRVVHVTFTALNSNGFRCNGYRDVCLDCRVSRSTQ